MSAKDISRFLLQPAKRYSGVRMQQGRVLLDSDFNEAERLDDEEARRTLLDILCSKGTPNGGFRVGDPVDAEVDLPRVEEISLPIPSYDLAIGAGSFYLGGLRFEAFDDPAESLLKQHDWLQIDAQAGGVPTRPSVEDLRDDAGNPRPRHDLVYLRGWEQCVSAVEDREIREAALGGPDTSVRMRRMRRVEILTGTEPTCDAAFAELTRALTEAPRARDGSDSPHDFDPESCELRSKARLTIGFGEGEPEDPCQPRVTQGFLGAENQTVRVQLTAPDRFIWGYDNAAPLYRVRVLENKGELVKIVFLTEPKDHASQPLQGQAVEILPWGALLPNREKVAELGGHLGTVVQSYDPDDPDGPSIIISRPVPEAWTAWLTAHPEYHSPGDPEGESEYLYLRLWTGGSGDFDEPDHAVTPQASVDLGSTGLTATFSDFGLPGDHWIVAGRPRTPAKVVPWDLLQEVEPVGNRFFFAPLGLIRWSVDDQGQVVADVHDCRTKFRPLCEVRGCCTVTVGDGVASHGDFQSIQDAVDSLPAEGGEICLLPGVHEARVTIRRRKNIKIHGCGKQTLVIPFAGDRSAPIFEIVDSVCVTLERMEMATLGGTAIVVGGTGRLGSGEIEIAHNRILAFGQAIRVERGVEIEIHHNRIRMLDKEGAGVGILLAARNARIERNDLGVSPARRTPPDPDPGDRPDPDPVDPCEDPEVVYTNPRFLLGYLTLVFRPPVGIFVRRRPPIRALGGIQIAAGSERVKILENRVHGGAGNGITLGGLAATLPDGPGEPEGEHIFENRVFRESISGRVFQDGQPGDDVSVDFTDSADVTTHAISISEGRYEAPISGFGKYLVFAPSPDFEIVDLEVRQRDGGEFHELNIEVRRVDPKPDPALALLREIRIAENDIASMGLSGIGIPHPVAPPVVEAAAVRRLNANLNRRARATVGRVGSPVLGLDIHRNEISRCLRTAFNATLDAVASEQGLGGVSLGFAADVTISENRIVENGRSHVDPACGIFIRLGQRVTIRENVVLDNAPLAAGATVEIRPGMRGGIVLTGASREEGRLAATIDHNVVSEPGGNALRLWAVGPVSVTANQFSSLIPQQKALGESVELVIFGDGKELPVSGDILFRGNQTHHGNSGLPFTRVQHIETDADLIYESNRSRAVRGGFVNTELVAGRALMAGYNRFEEPSRDSLSAWTNGSRVNNTSNNQGDHCIVATGPQLIDSPNQVLDTKDCRDRRELIARVNATFHAGLYREEI